MNQSEVQNIEEELDALSSKMDDKVVVSLDHINWEDAANDIKWAVLLKLATGRPLQKKSVEEALRKVWRLKDQSTTFLKVEKNTLLINFTSSVDQQRVPKGGPWSFEGVAILLQKWEPGMIGEDFECKTINIWVQLQRLPYELRSFHKAKSLAELAGKIKHTEEETQMGGEFVRFRIELDTTKPILPGFFLQRLGRKHTWISLKYVKLSNVCFNCGRFDHETRFCKGHQPNQEKLYGGWLKADTRIFSPI